MEAVTRIKHRLVERNRGLQHNTGFYGSGDFGLLRAGQRLWDTMY